MSSDVKSFGEHKANWVTISSDEYESMKSTLEVMSDPELFHGNVDSTFSLLSPSVFGFQQLFHHLHINIQIAFLST